MSTRILIGDVRRVIADLPADSVHTVITSPPYFGLRDYGTPGQIGTEATLAEYIGALVGVFAEVRRVLRPDGTLWLNIGDSYASGGNGTRDEARWPKQARNGHGFRSNHTKKHAGVRSKNLMMVPARLALALQDDGWELRSDIIWSKSNPMPESVDDRPTSAHEHIFLFSKRKRYFYDPEPIREAMAASTIARLSQPGFDQQTGGANDDGQHAGAFQNPATARNRNARKTLENLKAKLIEPGGLRGSNARNVWEMSTEPYPKAHFATFPTELPRRCLLAGTSERGCCPECGAPWRRITERTSMISRESDRRAQLGAGTT